MAERKYEFTGEKEFFRGYLDRRTLHRIRAVQDFDDVKAGDLGGWIEREENLSHDGNCWAYDEAQIFDNAQVHYSAKIRGYSRVYDNAQILGKAIINNSHVCDSAIVRHQVRIEDNSLVCKHARIYGSTRVCRSTISNCAYILDSVIKKVEISVPCSIYRGHIMSDRDLLTIGPIGSEDGILTVYRTQDGLRVLRGCFKGSLAEFAAAVEKRHGNNRHGRVYRSAIDLIRSYFGQGEVTQS